MGDVPQTFANCDLLERLTGYRPATSIDDGIAAFVRWYRSFYAGQEQLLETPPPRAGAATIG
jgi:UDP-glucuronate 4-epimerase